VRAVKGKNEKLSLISSLEAKIFNKIEEDGFLEVNTMSERENFLADDLYKRDIVKKVRRDNTIGYKTFKKED
tara:strand:- start:1276 stop:1491 length:216 start_codon:yes stop_codon:yes gene_type:complete